MLPIRHDALTQPRQRAESDVWQSTEKKVIFVCIIEIEQAEGLIVSRERPIVALCDIASSTSWVSSQFVEELERAGATSFEYTNQTSLRKGGRPSRIHIRWSCDRLGQNHEETTFFIEPKAQFKISFGCAYHTERLPSYKPGYYTRGKGKRTDQGPQISDQALKSFRLGIEEGILLPLEKMPPVPGNQVSLMTIADLEGELEYTHESYSYTDQTLSNISNNENNSSYPASYGGTFSSMDIASFRDYEIKSESPRIAASSNTSISEGSRRDYPLTEHLRSERAGAQPAYSIEGWFTQSVCEEPQPWIPRMFRPEIRPLSFKRCRDLTPKRQAKLAATRAAAEKEAADYWQWDEDAQRYKHYDEGCSEPVWYNPPQEPGCAGHGSTSSS